jgi:hypothetical protein
MRQGARQEAEKSTKIGNIRLPPVASLHRSQISENFDFKECVIDAGSGSRIGRLGQPILLFFGGQKFSTVCLDSFLLKMGS